MVYPTGHVRPTSLSPASKEIIEKCAVSAPPMVSNQDVRAMPTVISRPPSSAPDNVTGFHFAKPSHPIRNFSRSQLKPAGSLNQEPASCRAGPTEGPKSLPPSSPSARISKRQTTPRTRPNSRSRSPSNPSVPTMTPQASEEDLFYLLIHKMRQREESDRAAAGLKKKQEAEIVEITQVNQKLRHQLKEAELRCQRQETAINTNRDLTERWRVKFEKLKTFTNGIGKCYEDLRKDGQVIKSAQAALREEKQHMQDNLAKIHDDAKMIGEQCLQQKAQVAAIRHEVNSLEQALVVRGDLVKEKDKLIIQERNRVIGLENFIRSYSSKQQKQAASIEQKQSETLTKINSMSGHMESCWKTSHSALKAELESAVGSCLELLRSLSSRETAKSTDVTILSNCISALSSRSVMFGHRIFQISGLTGH